MKKVTRKYLYIFMAAFLLLSSCAQPQSEFPNDLYIKESQAIEILENEIPLTDIAPVATALQPTASGVIVHSNANATIDASNTTDGYVMVKYTGGFTNIVKVIIVGPSAEKYTYNLNRNGEYETFPLSDGNGTYKITVYKNLSGTRYSNVYSKDIEVTLKDEYAPFLLANQYVNYTIDSLAVAKAAELTVNCKTELEKVQTIYEFVVETLTYDTYRAQTVTSGYIPDIDSVLVEKKGICFDYATLMAAMLRSQNIPTKLVVGYTGDNFYHAWLSTWTAESGWIEGNIFFDGTNWKLMDPTFASTAKSCAEVMQYIANVSNYQAKYLY